MLLNPFSSSVRKKITEEHHDSKIIRVCEVVRVMENPVQSG